MRIDKLEELIRLGMSVREIGDKTGSSYTTIRYWLKKYDLKTKWSEECRKRWTDEEMLEAIRSSLTVADVLKKLGLKVRPGNYDTFNKFVFKNKVDVSHMRGSKIARGGKSKIPISELLVENCVFSRSKLKKRLLNEGILQNRCYMDGCPNPLLDWRGIRLNVVLDHINGIPNDNRIENLRVLCPNCNSQLKTHCGKNKKVF